MLASVVATLPGMPRLLQWMWTGCGSRSALPASVSVSRMARGVTREPAERLVEPGDVALRLTSRPRRRPGFTILIA